jgi:excisionase family DNA binding protein
MSDNNGLPYYVDDSTPYMLSVPQLIRLEKGILEPSHQDIALCVHKINNDPKYQRRVTKEPVSGYYYIDNSDQYFKAGPEYKYEYKVYMDSPEWKIRRQLFLSRDGYRCRLCHQPHTVSDPLQVHHATYDRVGNESDLDCISLCGSCHQLFHRKPPNQPTGSDVYQQTKDPDQKESLTLRKAAKLLNCSTMTVRRRIDRGEIKGFQQDNGQWLVNKESVMNSLQHRPPPKRVNSKSSNKKKVGILNRIASAFKKEKLAPKKEESSQIDYSKFWRVSGLDEVDRVNLEVDLQAMIPISQLSVKYDLPHNQIQSYCDYKGFKRRKK